MIKLLDTGKTKAIGVSNFSIEAIDAITKATGVAPAVHQVERHPRLLQRDLIKHHKANNIALTAYSGFGNNNIGEPLLLTHPTVKKIAEQKGADAGQVLIAWGMHGGHAIIPKSVTESRCVTLLLSTSYDRGHWLTSPSFPVQHHLELQGD